MIDLHCHTTYSDGADTPAELLRRAHQLGLETVAITDHDTLAGYDAAPAGPVRLVPGIELSVRGAHLLGYFFDGVRNGFRQWLETLRDHRRARNAAIADCLQRAGVGVTLEEAEALGQNITGRAHFARRLIEKGYAADWDEAFARYLGEDAPCYVEREDPEPEEGIERLRDAGATVSLAHPVRLRVDGQESYISKLTRAGLQAIEVWHSDHSEADAARYLALASKYGLAATAGSDYHGHITPQVELGSGRNGNIRGRARLPLF